jgi:hypothetical protein
MRQTTARIRGLRGAGAVLAAAGLMAALAMPAAAQETLVGEVFTGGPGLQDSIVNCAAGSGSMDAQGVATGPVPGVFLESVVYDFEPVAGSGSGALTALDADFVIREAVTNEVVATGFKTLIDGSTVCNTDTERTVTNATVNYFVDFPPFGAEGEFDEQGIATVVMVDDGPSDVDDALSQQFGAGGAVVTDKQQCKKGGWRDRTRADGSPFKNQGECIHYVNTGQ